jgi:antitoxin HicB
MPPRFVPDKPEIALFLHGGGDLNEIVRAVDGFIGCLTRNAPVRCVVPIYPLAPCATAKDVVVEVITRAAGQRLVDFDLTARQPMPSMGVPWDDSWPGMIYLIDITTVGGSQRATCKVFPEFVAVGHDRKQVRRNAAVVLEKVITARIVQGRGLPKPASEGQIERHHDAKVELSLMTAQKCSLYMALKKSGLDRAELARRLGWPREAVDSLLRPDHPSRIDHVEDAFKMLQRDEGGQVARKRRAEAAWAKVQTDT